MFDLDEMARWDEVLEALAHHEETDKLREGADREPAAARELEDA
ncbi:hypothetical protein [Rhodovulum euryhalinum]|uniref:Uncharacterized protein n=1 Tax=Rhodovulum euryhalinum TaxID=35805 RepID=A0A4R2KLT6_9RHOB|nr:hypothetical protein [Rhodovulum euryhalinum]TCO73582.1 hypothetical protein EV655_102347 [Rhodovulum euryhalinum]